MHSATYTIVVLGLLLTLQTQSMARLGESIKECNTRYGKPEQVNAPEKSILKLHQQTHLFNGYRVMIFFMDGKSAHEEFIRIKKENDGTRIISLSDQEAILSANTQSKFLRINEKNYSEGTFEWIDDSGTRAFRSTAGMSDGEIPSISLSTKKYLDYNLRFFDALRKKNDEEKAKKAQQEEKKLRERLKKF